MKRSALFAAFPLFLAGFLIDEAAQAQESPPQPIVFVPPPPEDTHVRPTFKVEYDHAFSNLYGLAIDQNGTRLAAGAQTQRLSAYVTADLMFGATPEGLPTELYAIGVELHYRALPYLRIGGGARGEMMLIGRATTSNDAMGALGYGFYASVDFDVIRWGAREDHGLFLGARMNVDLFNENDSGPVPVMYGPEIHAGFRF